MRDLEWIKKDNEKALARVAAGGTVYDLHETYRKQAGEIGTQWTFTRIAHDGKAIISKDLHGDTFSQANLFEMFPEISPRFFDNFGVDCMTITQKNGTQLILKRVR